MDSCVFTVEYSEVEGNADFLKPLSLCFIMSAIWRHSAQTLGLFSTLCMIKLSPFLLSSSLKEFEIELEGSQTLRLLCYEKSYNKTKQNKDDGDGTDRIIGKGQILV